MPFQCKLEDLTVHSVGLPQLLLHLPQRHVPPQQLLATPQLHLQNRPAAQVMRLERCLTRVPVSAEAYTGNNT
jgi:hypothetical protein